MQQKNESDMKEDSKTRRRNDRVSKEQMVKRKDKTKGKPQMSPKMDKIPAKHSATTTDRPQEAVKVNNGNNLSSKEKV